MFPSSSASQWPYSLPEVWAECVALTVSRRKWLNLLSNHGNKEHLWFTKIVVVERLGNSCGAATRAGRSKSVWRLALVGSVSLLQWWWETDLAGSLVLNSCWGFPVLQRALRQLGQHWWLQQEGQAGCDGQRWPVPRSKGAAAESHGCCAPHLLLPAQLLPACPGSPGNSNPKAPVNLGASAPVRYL